MMNAAVKFLSMPKERSREIRFFYGPTKLYDLAILDHEDLKELGKGKTVAGLNLDDVRLMTWRELKAKVIEARQELEAKDRVIAQRDKKISKLEESEFSERPWQKTFNDAVQKISELGNDFIRVCADLSRLTQEIRELEFEGVEGNDALALRVQLAHLYRVRAEEFTHLAFGHFLNEKETNLDKLVAFGSARLPADLMKKIMDSASVAASV
jgi:hypothetical protein